LFLVVIEERGLVFPKGIPSRFTNLYIHHYSVQRLRRPAVTRGLKIERFHDAWSALQATFHIFERPNKAAIIGTTALGGQLFHPQSLGPLPVSTLSNAALFNALDRLCYFDDPKTGNRTQVNFGALATEEFGSVYESLLELHPLLKSTPTPHFRFKQAAGNEGKNSGSYYTPAGLVDCLLESALDPMLNDRLRNFTSPGYPSADAAVLALKVCDPACGSGHFLIAAAQRIARRLAMLRAGDEEPGPELLRHTLREVIGHCIFGVDINPRIYRQIVEGSGYDNARLLHDAWYTAFVWPKNRTDYGSALTTEHLRAIEHNPHSIAPRLKETVRQLAGQYRFFHWHLEFPAVFGADGDGGFDVTLGDPAIANAPNAATRKRLIVQLTAGNPGLMAEFQAAARQTEGESHLLRDSGLYPLGGRGDINLYAVFAELGRQRSGAHGLGAALRHRYRRHHQALFSGRGAARRAGQPVRFREQGHLSQRTQQLQVLPVHRRIRAGSAGGAQGGRDRWVRLLRPLRGRPQRPRTSVQPLRCPHCPAQPQYPHLPHLPQPPGCGADQNHLS
jgi:hypothetical protein